ncbi:Membrane protein [Streptomyces graminofaciens]|uniref:Membrane protein n=1 Tax=Streptomyces graminofaciens TaxID=68212 RepID=A0ABM7FA63_9ACTN|nr:DUF4307 domain-containing protein [Streptomyces graminofaciens]BBC33349.1 Membrane protein [Streptomyces graminofaciens]
MSTASTQLPDGRYGRSADGRADHKLKVIGAALGAAMLVLVGWFAYHYVVGNRVSVEIYTFETSANSVKVHLRGDKDAGVEAYCTVRSQAEDGAEVGRADFRFDADTTTIDKVFTLRTTSRGTTAELLGCHAN